MIKPHLGDIAGLDIRLYQPGDDEKIIELLKKTFPGWGKTSDPLRLWRWKYIDTPHGSLIAVALVDNKIIGCNHSMYFKAKLGSEVTLLSWGDDLAVDTDYRGNGIWAKMRDKKAQKVGATIKYSYSITTNPIVKNDWVKRKRALFPFPVIDMVKIKDIGLHLNMRHRNNILLEKYGYSSLRTLNRVMNQFSSPIEPIEEFEIIEVSSFDERIDSFWEKIKDDYEFILEKKQAILNWRLCDPRMSKQIVIQAMHGDEVLGFMVMGLSEAEGYAKGQIKDLIALENRLDVADALLNSACNYFDELDVNAVSYRVVEGHPYQRLSERKGFIDSRSKTDVQFDYSTQWREEHKEGEVQFLKQMTPSRAYFNYADTV